MYECSAWWVCSWPLNTHTFHSKVYLKWLHILQHIQRCMHSRCDRFHSMHRWNERWERKRACPTHLIKKIVQISFETKSNRDRSIDRLVGRLVNVWISVYTYWKCCKATITRIMYNVYSPNLGEVHSTA